jgi:hypothetical protein
MRTWTCIYCKNQFAKPAPIPEHIIFKSLGGRSTSRTLVCGELPQDSSSSGDVKRSCNNLLSPIEEKLVSLPPIQYARAVLGLGRSKDLQAEFETDDGEKVGIGREGELKHVESVLQFRVRELAPRIKEFCYKLSNEEALSKIEQQLEREGQSRDKRVYKDIQWCTGKKMKAKADFTEEEYRAVAKLAFEALAYGAEWVDVRSSSFDEVRYYILNGQKPAGKEFAWLDRQQIYTLLPIDDPFYNRVTLFCNPDTQLIIGFVEILRHFTYSVLLAEDYHGPRQAFQLLNQPLDKSKTKDEITILKGRFNKIELQDLEKNDREPLLGRLQDAWSNLGNAVDDFIFRDPEKTLQDFMDRLIRIAIENVGYPGKKYFEPNDYFYIARFVAERMAPLLGIDAESLELELLASFLNYRNPES